MFSRGNKVWYTLTIVGTNNFLHEIYFFNISLTQILSSSWERSNSNIGKDVSDLLVMVDSITLKQNLISDLLYV